MIQNFPKISIITPSLNQASFIEKTLKSVLDQNYPNLEYIVIDGGSTDGTIEIINKYKNQLSYCVSERDSGQSNAINKGFKKATGDIYTWLGSDDLLQNGALFELAEMYRKNPKVGLYIGKCYKINENNEIIGEKGPDAFTEINILNRWKQYQPAVFFNRIVLDKVGLLDEDLHYAMDTDYFLKIRLHGFEGITTKFYIASARFWSDCKSVASGYIHYKELREVLEKYSALFNLSTIQKLSFYKNTLSHLYRYETRYFLKRNELDKSLSNLKKSWQYSFFAPHLNFKLTTLLLLKYLGRH